MLWGVRETVMNNTDLVHVLMELTDGKEAQSKNEVT